MLSSYASESWTTCEMADDSRCQFAVSDSSCFLAEARERVELGAPVVLRLLPLGRDPAFLLQLVQGRVERAFADLQHVSRDRVAGAG